ncbi:TPA: hypothetical protein ACSRG2_002309 [Klebsiella pneumoniae]
MTNNQLTDAQISNATLIRLIRWADEHKSHYVAAALRELQERRKADSEPVAWMHNNNNIGIPAITTSQKVGQYWMSEFKDVQPLYRHAQPAPELKPVGYLFVSDQGAIAYSPTDWGMPGFKLAGQIFGDIDVELKPAPVVPDDVLDALQKVARIRLDLNDFDGDRRGIADCLCDAEEALIEVVNRRAAMVQELKKSAGTEAICRSNENVQVLHTISPAQSDCCPEQNGVDPEQNNVTPAQDGNYLVIPDGYVMVPKEPTKEMIDAGWLHFMGTKNPSSKGTYKAMLAAAPQEEKIERKK